MRADVALWDWASIGDTVANLTVTGPGNMSLPDGGAFMSRVASLRALAVQGATFGGAHGGFRGDARAAGTLACIPSAHWARR